MKEDVRPPAAPEPSTHDERCFAYVAARQRLDEEEHAVHVVVQNLGVRDRRIDPVTIRRIQRTLWEWIGHLRMYAKGIATERLITAYTSALKDTPRIVQQLLDTGCLYVY